jgi:hypothetical protein
MNLEYAEIEEQVLANASRVMSDVTEVRWTRPLKQVLFKMALANLSGCLSGADPRVYGELLLTQELVRLCHIWDVDSFKTEPMLTDSYPKEVSA